MVEEIATVVSADGNGLWLTTTPVASCNACQASDDCGTGIVAKTLTPKSLQFYIPSELQLLPGEQVKIGLPEQQLVAAALMVYLVPLLLMLVAVVLGNALLLSELWLIVLAIVAGGAGFLLARRYDQLQQQDSQIRILEVLPSLGVNAAQK